MNSYLFEYNYFTYSCNIPHYRNLFNGQEADNEVYGKGAVLGYEFRQYDARIGRWWSVDPLADKYPGVGPYVFCADSPIVFMDPSGQEADDNLDKWEYNKTTGELKWISSEGGKNHQTVIMKTGKGKDETAYQKIDFNGPITKMFDPSVFSPKADGTINGGLDVINGGIMAFSGAAIAVGSEGTASSIGYPIFVAGATQMSFGAKTIAYSLSGDNGIYDQHNMMVDICKSIANSTIPAIPGMKNQPLKKIGSAAISIVTSITWSGVQHYKATHPRYKGIPENSSITNIP